MGLSIAASMALPGIGGMLVSCVIDGTFVDMLKAVSTGDWAMLALSCAAFVPGGNPLKGLKAVGGLSKVSKVIAPYKVLSKTAAKEGKQAHHLIEKRFAKTLGVKHGDIPSVALTRERHQEITNRWRDAIGYGTGTKTATKNLILEKAKEVYYDEPEMLRATLDYLAKIP